ncbi:MAG: bifunctional glycogen debranching protein GlgX/4-alpha-glucanotransferase [Desulfitobacteriaceae bacterium]
MNFYAYHNSYDLFYRKPFGAVECGQKIIFRLKTCSALSVEACYLRLWEKNQEKVIPMSLIPSAPQDIFQGERPHTTNGTMLNLNPQEDINSNLDRGDPTTPEIAHALELRTSNYELRNYEVPATPGLVWYYFIIQVGSQTYYYGNNEERLGGEGLLREQEQSPAYQITVYRPVKAPEWYKRGVMYQIFVDRFYNGRENGWSIYPRKNSLIHTDWNDNPIYIKDERGRVTHWDFFGGNLEGVLKKLPYLQELGINIIYFNPIFDSPSNHKYDTADYLRIDPAFGDEATFELLVTTAKSLGISIVLDGVFSHTGSDSIYFNKDSNYPELGAYQSADSPYYEWYQFKQGCDDYKCWWDVDTLPEVNEMNLSYRQFIYGSEESVISKWMKKGVAGWRLDVADELPDEFIQELRQAVKEINSDAVLIGEVWEDASNKASYGKLREYFWGCELDATMNYPWREIFLEFLLGRSGSSLVHRQILSLYENYPRENFYAAMNLIGSHDRARILTLLGEAPPEQDLTDSERQSYRLSPSARQLAVQRLKLLSLVQMTFPGVPCVYYGDEVGLEGYSDPYNRGTYPWGREDREIQDWYKKIIRMREEYEVLQTGDFQSFYSTPDVYGFKRTGEVEEITVLINRHSTQVKNVTLDLDTQRFSLVIDLLNGEIISREEQGYSAGLTLEIGPLSGRVFLGEKNDPAFGRQRLPQSCGILMPISSLPSAWGLGDLGEEAYQFIDFLADSGQSLWQVLPLNPTGLGDSPYQSASAFAGNPMFISLDHLLKAELLNPEEVHKKLDKLKSYSNEAAAHLKKIKNELLRESFKVFQARLQEQESDSPAPGDAELKYLSLQNYLTFIKENEEWLEDYALFRALKARFGGVAWYDWETGLASRSEESLAEYTKLLAEEIEFGRFVQYTFYYEWQELREYARAKGISLLGDMPLFVAADSCDVWVNRRFFKLDESGKPAKVAGVPPDYFSKTGQRWGNPVYDWESLAADQYSWWKKRIRLTLRLFDYIRLDHFRGLEAYWEIEAGEETAVKGRWMKGPGKKFFESLFVEFGKLPFIAEDLGFITAEVNILKRIFGFPGMKILQFTPMEEGMSENYHNFVYYSGTHDNDTLLGWYKTNKLQDEELKMSEKDEADKINENDEMKIACRRLIEDLYMSEAAWVIIPLQDILGLDTDARMNVPGTTEGNWHWKLSKKLLTEEVKLWLRSMAETSKRLTPNTREA